MVTTPIITFIADPREPDLYVDVTDLPNPFTMNIPIGISNTHPSSQLWFKVSMVSPPAAYSVSSTNLGSLTPGTNGIFTMTPERTQPTLTAGEYDEILTFKVEAFTDSSYSALYADEELSVTVHHFNHTDASWTVIDHSDFDDGTVQGWGTSGYYVESGGYVFWAAIDANFLSSPYAYHSGVPAPGKSYKNMNTAGYSKARLVLHFKECGVSDNDRATINLMINYVLRKPMALKLPRNQWCRLAYNVPIGSSIEIAMSCMYGSGYGYGVVDEIWVIAK